MMTLAKIDALIVLTMRYERVQSERELTEHPYHLVQGLVEEAVSALEAWRDIAVIESPDATLPTYEPMDKETLHKDLFQALWTQFNLDEYRDRIERFGHRLDVNGLSDAFLAGERYFHSYKMVRAEGYRTSNAIDRDGALPPRQAPSR